MNDKYDPTSPKFNWTALAQRNEDETRNALKAGKAHRDGRAERVHERHAKSERHQAAMRVLDMKMRGRGDKYTFRDMLKGELGQ